MKGRTAAQQLGPLICEACAKATGWIYARTPPHTGLTRANYKQYMEHILERHPLQAFGAETASNMAAL